MVWCANRAGTVLERNPIFFLDAYVMRFNYFCSLSILSKHSVADLYVPHSPRAEWSHYNRIQSGRFP